MAVIYPIRPFLWTQIRNICVLAASAASNWQLAKPKTSPRIPLWPFVSFVVQTGKERAYEN